MGYYIIYDHALMNPRLATKTEDMFEGSEKTIERAIYFSNKDEAEDYLQGNFFGQCAAIVKIVDTWDN